MQIDFDEIFVGERNRSMGILSSSLSEEFSRQLAHLLDLPGQPPQGFSVTSYISGTDIGNKYVFARTTTDQNAERGGMVFSHAFVVDKSSVGKIDNLKPIVGALLNNRPVQIQASRRSLDIDVTVLNPPPGRFCDIITAYPSSVVVLTDRYIYEDLMIRTWARLLPSMRSNLRFGMSFDPEESFQQGLDIALVPSVTLQRWPTNRRADAVLEDEPAHTAAGRYLANTDVNEITSFVDTLELQNVKLSDLALIGRACEVFHSNSISISDALAALRIIASLQPSPGKGTKIKTQLMQTAFADPGSFKPDNVLALRNFDWAPFQAGPISPDSLTHAFEASFLNHNEEDAKKDILISIFDSGVATEEWRKSGIKAVENINDQAAFALAPTFWTILRSTSNLGAELLCKAPARSLDLAMARVAFDPKDIDSEPIRRILINTKYFLSEAALLIQSYSGDHSAALSEACTRESTLFGTIAIESILAEMSENEVVDAALNINHTIIETEAVKYIVNTPSLLNTHSLIESKVQKLWLKGLKKCDDTWRIHQDPSKIQDDLFLALCSSSGIESHLLNYLMKTQLGDWFEFTKRTSVWNLLKSNARESALARTAKHWISNYPPPTDTTAYFSPEDPLASAIAAPNHHSLLQAALYKGNLGQALNTFLGNEQLSENLFLESFSKLYQSEDQLGQNEVELSGRIVTARGWHSVTRELFLRFCHFNVPDNLRPFFIICAEHLKPWDRWRNNLQGPSQEQLFELLIDVSCNLYPSGPNERLIWERSGGDSSRVNQNGSGQEQWQTAIRESRYGGHVYLKNLITHMLEDFPHNAQLKYLLEAL